MSKNDKKITICKNGPYLVSGSIPLDHETIECDSRGIPIKWGKGKTFSLEERYSLCRCGKSKNMPFCDASHTKSGFVGTETAGHKNFSEMNDPTVGPELVMNDAEKLCAVALFCHRAGDAWTLTEHSDDPKKKKTAIEEACDCPSGRLVAQEKKSGKVLEPDFTPEISVVKDNAHHVSGPLWVKGGIPIVSSDGIQYEVRNRVTLCRCGASKNKPFCDGTHCSIK